MTDPQFKKKKKERGKTSKYWRSEKYSRVCVLERGISSGLLLQSKPQVFKVFSWFIWQLREPTYDWGPHRKTREHVIVLVIGLIIAFSIKFLHGFQLFAHKADHFLCPKVQLRKSWSIFPWNLLFSSTSVFQLWHFLLISRTDCQFVKPQSLTVDNSSSTDELNSQDTWGATSCHATSGLL